MRLNYIIFFIWCCITKWTKPCKLGKHTYLPIFLLKTFICISGHNLELYSVSLYNHCFCRIRRFFLVYKQVSFKLVNENNIQIAWFLATDQEALIIAEIKRFCSDGASILHCHDAGSSDPDLRTYLYAWFHLRRTSFISLHWLYF